MDPKLQPSLPFAEPTTAPTKSANAERPAANWGAPELDSFSKRDAFEFLASLPSGSVDLVVTDPPYESLELHRSRGTTTRLVGNWFQTLPMSELPRLFHEIFRVLKADRHFYLFCDEFVADAIKEQQGITSARDRDGARECESGFRYWREIVWVKTTRDGNKIQAGMGYHYRSASERILFFEKGKRKLNDLSVPDVLMAARPEHKAPAGKPLEVNQTLIEQSTLAGELVVDPFAGSGVAGLAAMKTGRHFWLNDLDDSYLLPEVQKKAMPYLGRFLLVLPHTSNPEHFISELIDEVTVGVVASSESEHDRDMFGLGSPAGIALLQKLASMRPLERAPLVRRHIRASPWMSAARTAAADPATAKSPGHSELTTWLEWLEK
jgi:site-specific DNA-methyltransferase (adenine-specific)